MSTRTFSNSYPTIYQLEPYWLPTRTFTILPITSAFFLPTNTHYQLVRYLQYKLYIYFRRQSYVIYQQESLPTRTLCVTNSTIIVAISLRPLLKSASTDVIISNHVPILGYSQIGVLSKL